MFSIVTTLSLAGGATYAYFSDQGQSLGNSIQTGTLDLRLSDENETDSNSVTTTFGGNLAPGQCAPAATLHLKNTGTIAANHAQITLTNTVTDVGDNASQDIQNYLKFQTLTFDGADKKGAISDGNANSFPDLGDWAMMSDGLDNLPLSDLNTDHPLVIQVCLDSSAPNELQGDSVSTDITVTLNQDSSQ